MQVMEIDPIQLLLQEENKAFGKAFFSKLNAATIEWDKKKSQKS